MCVHFMETETLMGSVSVGRKCATTATMTVTVTKSVMCVCECVFFFWCAHISVLTLQTGVFVYVYASACARSSYKRRVITRLERAYFNCSHILGMSLLHAFSNSGLGTVSSILLIINDLFSEGYRIILRIEVI